MRENKLLDYIRDVIVALLFGFAFSAVISGVCALIGLFAGMYPCLDAAKRIEFVIGALLLLVLAFTLMKRGKKPTFAKVLTTENWTRFFRRLGFPEVFGLVGVGLILGGCVLDFWLVPMKAALGLI